METKRCARCDTTKPVTAFYLNKGRVDGLSGYCAECQRAAEATRKHQARLNLISDLGGCCVTCGFADWRALQIDHINGDGAIDRIENPNTNSAKFYAAVRANPDRYALICANCNWIKRHENQECIGKRVYQRTEPQEKRQGEGRWSPEANARRSATAKAGWTDERRAEKAEEMRSKATGRKMVSRSDGSRGWVYPGDPDYPAAPKKRISQEEHSRRVSEAKKGQPASPQALANLAKGHTPEVMAKARQASAEARKDGSSEETKAKIAEGLKRAYAEGRRQAGHSEQTKEKIRLAKTLTTWAKDHAECVRCQQTTSPHKAKGVCSRCYYQGIRQAQGITPRNMRATSGDPAHPASTPTKV